MKQRSLFLILALVLAVSLPRFVFAAWNGQPYNPGDTLNPECAPTDENCTVQHADYLWEFGDGGISFDGDATLTGALHVQGGLDVTGGILASQGTGASNGFGFSGDGDTGIYSSGDGVLSLYSNNIRGLHLLDGANVFIDHSLTVDGKILAAQSDGTAGGYTFQNDGDTGLYSSGDGNLQFFNNNNKTITIDSAGKLGLGVENPLYVLDVNGRIRIRGANDADGGIWLTKANAPESDIAFIGRGSGSEDWTGFYSDQNGWNLAVRDNGNVGIGNTGPNYKLDVSGDINFTGDLYQNGTLFSPAQTLQESWTNSTGTLSYIDGFVGIGTTTPNATLAVGGDFFVQNNTTVGQVGYLYSHWFGGTNPGNGGRILSDVQAGVNLSDYAPMGVTDNYAGTVYGYIKADYTEEYTITINADDGVRLWIDNQQLVDAWNVQTCSPHSATIHMTAGRWVPIRIEHYQAGGGECLQLGWESANQTAGLIPADHMAIADPNTQPTIVARDGNVGIGTADMLAKLHVEGSMMLSGLDEYDYRYLNFGNVAGQSGYGIRNNDGVMQFKNYDDDWMDIGANMGDPTQWSNIGEGEGIAFDDGKVAIGTYDFDDAMLTIGQKSIDPVEEIGDGNFTNGIAAWNAPSGWEFYADNKLHFVLPENAQFGKINSHAVTGGNGYHVGDIITVDDGNHDAQFEVIGVGISGGINFTNRISQGSGYSPGTYGVTGGSGTGASVVIYTVMGDDFKLTQSGSLDENDTFRVRFTIGGDTGTVRACLDVGDCRTATAGSGVIEYYGKWASAGPYKIVFDPSMDFNGYLTDISVELADAHIDTGIAFLHSSEDTSLRIGLDEGGEYSNGMQRGFSIQTRDSDGISRTAVLRLATNADAQYEYLLPSLSGIGQDTFCMLNLGNCSGGVEQWDTGPEGSSLGFNELAHYDDLDGDAKEVAYANDTLYAVTDNAFYVFDIEDQDALSQQTQLASTTLSDGGLLVRVNGDVAYVATQGGFYVYNVNRTDMAGNSNVPILLGSYTFESQAWVSDMQIVDGKIYAVVDNTLQIYDVLEITRDLPGDPITVGSFGLLNSGIGLSVDDGKAYVTNSNGDLEIIDVVDPLNFRRLGVHYDEFYGGVTVSGDYAYVTRNTSSGASFLTLDISNPGNSNEIGYANIGDWRVGTRLVKSGNIVYVADGQPDSLYAVDISDPTHPHVRGHVTTAGRSFGLAINGEFAYLADNENGILIYGIETGDRLTTNKKVGIGTDNPLAALDVAGSAILSGLDGEGFRYLNFGTSTGASGYGIRNNNGVMQFKNAADNSWTDMGGVVSGDSAWNLDGTELSYAIGPVGIGTSNLSGAALTIRQGVSGGGNDVIVNGGFGSNADGWGFEAGWFYSNGMMHFEAVESTSTGSIGSQFIDTGGTGYHTGDQVGADGGDGNAVFTVNQVHGGFSAVNLNSGGTNYQVGDILTIVNNTTDDGRVEVTSVDGSGTILTTAVTVAGSDYSSGGGYGLSGGSGTGGWITGGDGIGSIDYMDITNAGTGYTSGLHNLTGGSGSGATAYITANNDGPDYFLIQEGDLVQGQIYTISLDIGGSTGSVDVCITVYDCSTYDAGAGHVSFASQADLDQPFAGLRIFIYPSDDFGGTIDNVSVTAPDAGIGSGENQIQNGGFDMGMLGDEYWDAVGGWSIGEGVAGFTYDPGSMDQPFLVQMGELEEGGQYTVAFDIGGSVGTVTACLGFVESACQEFSAGDGEVSFSGIWTADQFFFPSKVVIIASMDFDGTVDNVSVRNANSTDGITFIESSGETQLSIGLDEAYGGFDPDLEQHGFKIKTVDGYGITRTASIYLSTDEDIRYEYYLPSLDGETGDTFCMVNLANCGAGMSFWTESDSGIAFSGGDVSIGGGTFYFDSETGITSIDNLAMGAMEFPEDAGVVSWIDLPIASAAASTTQSYSASIAGEQILTIYGVSDGSGGVVNLSVGVGTTTPWNTFSVDGTFGLSGIGSTLGLKTLCLTGANEVVTNDGECVSSTERVKHSITLLEISGTSTLMQLMPSSFVYDYDASSTEKWGFIAEDLASTSPMFIDSFDADGKPLTINTKSILAVIVKALKEVIVAVNDLAKRIQTDEVTTKKLCVEDTCITQDEFKRLLQNASIQSVAPPGSPDPTDPGSASGDPSNDSPAENSGAPSGDPESTSGSGDQSAPEQPVSDPAPAPAPEQGSPSDSATSDSAPAAPSSPPDAGN